MIKEELANNIGKSRATITRNIKVLIKNGILIRQGSDKSGNWKIINFSV